jgi:PAS domain S-box-containing protein
MSFVPASNGVNIYSNDITARVHAEEAQRQSEGQYRLLFQNMLEGFAYCRMVFDERGRPEDFVYLGVNDAFGRLTGLHDVVGKKVTEIIPGIREAHPELLETYGRVARTGQPERLDIDFRPLGKWLSISVYRPHLDHFVVVFDDITSRKQVEQELRNANRAKDEFLNLLSHELRNPLAPISNSLFILEHAEPTGQQARRAKEVIGRQVGHLTHLVDDLLEVTRITRGKVELRRARLDLGELVRLTGEDYRDLLKKRGVDFSIDTQDRAVWVDGDETRLAQVIGNLLHNAAKFTPTGGKVMLSVVKVDGEAELHVIDTGTGIDPALLGRVFEPFVQAEQSLARTEGGLGLGLALVKGLVELHGGSVEAHSGGSGRGAEFVVHLRTVPSPEPDRADAAGVRLPQRVLRVLVVEDNADAAESLAELVRMLGHEVEVAYDGPSAIAKATAVSPDLVLCDIGLPGMNGYDVARALRSNPKLRSTRLVAVTGYAQPEDVERATEAGFIGHIPKPPSPSVLERYLVT